MLGAMFALSSVLIPFCLGAAIGGIASGPRAGRQRGRRPVDLVAEPDVGADRASSAVLTRRATSRPSTWPATRVRAGLPDLVRGVPRPRAGRRRRDRRASRSAGCSSLRADARDALRRADLAAAASRWCSSRARPASATLALVWRERYGLARVDRRGRGRGDHRRLGARPGARTCCRPSSRSTRRRRATRRSSALLVIAVGVGWSSSCRRCGACTGSCCRAGSTRSTSRSTSASAHEASRGRHVRRLVVGLVLMVGFEHVGHARARRARAVRVHRHRRVPDRRPGVPGREDD